MNQLRGIKKKETLNFVIQFLAFIALLSQFSCTYNTSKEKNKPIILASKGKIDSLDPAQASKLLAIQLISALGDTLYRINSDGSLEPRLAKEKPQVSKDGLTILIPLREDVLFHDNTPFNAKAMAFSIERFINIGTLNYIINDRIKSIETPEEFLLKIKLEKPSSSINGLLTSINLTPVSPIYYSQYKGKFINETLIGTGPYKLINYSPERQSLVPFDNYWDEKPANSGINYISFNTSASLFNAIKTSQVDILLSNSIEDGHRLSLHRSSQKGDLIEAEGPAMQIGYIAFNTKAKTLKPTIIRQALLHSFDRELISEQVSYGLREPLRALIPPIIQVNNVPQWPKYDPKTAKKFFKEAGLCNNNKLTLILTFRSNVPADKLLALTWKEQVKRDLSDCLEIALNGVESTTVYKQLSDGIYEAVILGWTGDYPDPYAYLSPLLDCKEIVIDLCKEGEAVFGGTFWANKDIQKSLEKSESLLGNKRLEELRKIETIAADGASLLPIWILKPRVWVQKDISQPEFDGSGRLRLDMIRKKHE